MEDADKSSAWHNDDIFSPLVKSFSFSFSSSFPLQGEAGSSRQLKYKHKGTGEVKVDAFNRRLFMRSEAKNVSEGIPTIETKVIYRADQGRLWAMTTIPGPRPVTQCWQISTAEAIPLPPRGVTQNPFLRAKHALSGVSIPDSSELAQKYVLFLDQSKRVEFYIDDHRSLAYMKLDHLDRDVSAGIRIRDWSTAPVDDQWFEAEKWQCDDMVPIEYAEQLSAWEIIQVFLPTQSDEDEVSRRLHAV